MEADLTHQVVYYAVNGQVERIMDSSTGGGYWYTEYGASYQAITPEGQFSVQRIVDGPVTSPLGWLWRPAYFTGGYAIHGEPEVPPYPVSHGCIRIIMDAQDGMFPLYFVGMPVYVYGNPPYAG
jgi:lipoprotein-anchoring transpeptidase ErfK/SrfK